jgi:hypothetical protein
MIELIPTENSPTEVKNPKTKNDTANDDILRVLEIRSTALIAKPEPTHIPTNANKYKIT